MQFRDITAGQANSLAETKVKENKKNLYPTFAIVKVTHTLFYNRRGVLISQTVLKCTT